MKIIYKMAFRNIFRRKSRSSLLIIIIATGVFAASFVVAFVNGWTDSCFKEHIDMQTSYLQIHTNGFSDTNDVSKFMDKGLIKQALDAVSEVEHASYRLKTNALLSTAQTSVGLTLIGVNRDEEIKVSSIYSTIDSCHGTFFESGDFVRPIVISRRSAERLNAALKSRIIITLQNSSGEIQKVQFRVGGLFQTNSRRFDNVTAFVQNSDLMPYLNIPDGVAHEVAVVVNSLKECNKAKQELSQLLPDHDVKKWDEAYPLMQLLEAWHVIANFLFLALFFTALAFSITNFMLMSVLERKGEFNMLKKVGMGRNHITLMIVIETLFVTLIGTMVGLIICLIVVLISSKSGIDIRFLFNNETGYGFGTIIYPMVSKRDFIHIFVLVLIISMMASISPAKKVMK